MLSVDNWALQVTAQVLIVAGSAWFGFAQETAAASTPSTETVVDRLMSAQNRQLRQLQSFDVVRNYRVDYHGFGGARHAEMQVLTSYVSPNRKEFRVISENGSKFLLDHILNKLLESEKDYQLDQSDSDLSPRNYEFKLLGTERSNNDTLYLIEITPRRKAKYLCHGEIWVNARDFGIVRLEGQPAKNPSFWISHTQMANTYQKLGDFWLPVHKDASSDVRLGGKAVLTIDYSDYRITQNSKSPLEAFSEELFGIARPTPPAEDRR